MTLRIFLDEHKLQLEGNRRLLQAGLGHHPTPDDAESSRLARLAERKLHPDDWRHFYVCGLRLNYDDDRGQPYVGVFKFRTLVSGTPPTQTSLYALEQTSLITSVTISDEWTGDQVPAHLHGEVIYRDEGPDWQTGKASVEAVITRRGETVHVDIVVSCAKRCPALEIYWLIRNHPSTYKSPEEISIKNVDFVDRAQIEL